MHSESESSSSGRITSEDAVRFRRCVLGWWRRHARRFPWRETTDPYSVLLAEVLLQKTDAPKVVPVFTSMSQTFPTLESLAAANPRRVAKLLDSLGLDYRTERLRHMARDLLERYGEVPPDVDALTATRGIGRYIASAVCAQAFGQRWAVLDTNVIRVLDRYFGVRSNRPRARDDPRMWEAAQQLLPQRASHAARWNWALLDFAAAICSSRRPGCDACLPRSGCATHRRSHPAEKTSRQQVSSTSSSSWSE